MANDVLHLENKCDMARRLMMADMHVTYDIITNVASDHVGASQANVYCILGRSQSAGGHFRFNFKREATWEEAGAPRAAAG
jgi:hypothetical protein